MKTLILIGFIYLAISWFRKLKRYNKQKNDKYHEPLGDIIVDSNDIYIYLYYGILFQ